MSEFKNVMEIFHLLEKNNCQECGEKTCLAFSATVFQGKRELSECTLLSPEISGQYQKQEKRPSAQEEDFNKIIKELLSRLQEVDLEKRAELIGASYANNKISLKIMGKDFSIDPTGKVFTDIHVNGWIYVCVLNYLIHCQGRPLTGNWVPLRELPGGQDWNLFFTQQCEKQLKKTADTYPDLFADLVGMFSGKQVDTQFQSDVAVILSPLPMIPLLICYWKPEDGMGSSLNLFFDDTATDNLGVDGLYLLGTGIAQMLEKLARQHGSTVN